MPDPNEEICADRIRFTLSDASGQLAFSTFEVAGGVDCLDAERKLREYLIGRPLAKVDLRVVERLSCANGRGCFEKIAAVIREQQDLFGSEDAPDLLG